jgi:hypothetical protein
MCIENDQNAATTFIIIKSNHVLGCALPEVLIDENIIGITYIMCLYICAQFANSAFFELSGILKIFLVLPVYISFDVIWTYKIYHNSKSHVIYRSLYHLCVVVVWHRRNNGNASSRTPTQGFANKANNAGYGESAQIQQMVTRKID